MEAGKYDLITSGIKNTSAVSVKLTDSALYAFEDLGRLKNKGGDRRPTIKFEGQHGVIHVPTRKSELNPDGIAAFQFTMANQQQSGAIDCIQQHDGHSRRPLQLLGAMNHRLSIQAMDDTYKQTKDRMTLAEEEKKKTCTKQLNALGKSKKVKRSITAESLSARLASAQSSQDTGAAQSLQHKSSAADISKYTFRERIIHILAVRAYRRPELIARLKRDGVSGREDLSTLIDSTLRHVATHNSHKDTYHLMRHLYRDEVRPEWPLYSAADRETLFKNLQQLAGQTHSTSGAAGQSAMTAIANSNAAAAPGSVTTAQPTAKPSSINQKPQTHSQSSHVGASGADGSLLKVPHKEAQGKLEGSSKASELSKSSGGRSRSKSKRPALAMRGVDARESKSSRLQDDIADGLSKRTGISSTVGTTPAAVSASGICHTNGVDHLSGTHSTKCTVDASLESCKPDYLDEFTEIKSADERLRVKAAFNADYKEYLDLRGIVEETKLKFNELEAKLRRAKSGTPEFEKAKDEISTEFNKLMSGGKYEEQKERFQYLHAKLSHIKQRVADFDESRT